MKNILELVMENEWFQSIDETDHNYIGEDEILETYIPISVDKIQRLILEDIEYDESSVSTFSPSMDEIVSNQTICLIKNREKNVSYDPDGNKLEIVECERARFALLDEYGVMMGNKIVFPSQAQSGGSKIGAYRFNSIR